MKKDNLIFAFIGVLFLIIFLFINNSLDFKTVTDILLITVSVVACYTLKSNRIFRFICGLFLILFLYFNNFLTFKTVTNILLIIVIIVTLTKLKSKHINITAHVFAYIGAIFLIFNSIFDPYDFEILSYLKIIMTILIIFIDIELSRKKSSSFQIEKVNHIFGYTGAILFMIFSLINFLSLHYSINETIKTTDTFIIISSTIAIIIGTSIIFLFVKSNENRLSLFGIISLIVLDFLMLLCVPTCIYFAKKVFCITFKWTIITWQPLFHRSAYLGFILGYIFSEAVIPNLICFSFVSLSILFLILNIKINKQIKDC